MLRKVLITGASRGIGKATSDRLLKSGHEVWGIARTDAIESHPRFHPHSIDLSKVETLPNKLSPFTGVDTVICNVGKGHFGNLEELSYSQIHSLIDLNFFSHVYLIKELLPHLKKKPQADIIFIGSEAALAGKRKGSIYCASKFALRGFAQSLREECSTSSVRVSLIQPGMVRTPFYDPLSFTPGEDPSHAILPEDIAEMVDMILKMRHETVFDEVILSPKKRVVQKKGRYAWEGKKHSDQGLKT
ncbi:MAG: SDR family oxidoreductase [Chlamydiia bacterium]|nr:SDR family oxidoreductase [Chlamydiia bacterium]